MSSEQNFRDIKIQKQASIGSNINPIFALFFLQLAKSFAGTTITKWTRFKAKKFTANVELKVVEDAYFKKNHKKLYLPASIIPETLLPKNSSHKFFFQIVLKI